MSHRHHSASERTFDPAHAERLDDPARRDWLLPERVEAGLRLHSSMDVTDIGAGTGYFALPLARATRPGVCFAIDFEPRRLEILRERSAVESNLTLMHGEASATTLTVSCCDLAFSQTSGTSSTITPPHRKPAEGFRPPRIGNRSRRAWARTGHADGNERSTSRAARQDFVHRHPACENTTERKGVARDALFSFATTVDAGVAEVVRKQEEGWSYAKSGF